SVPSRGLFVRGGVHVKVIRRSDHPHQLLAARPISHRNTFFFYEKNSGVAHFHVSAGPDGRLPVDKAAGLLAMHCLVRGQTPSDYAVLVQAENDILENLIEKADQLLEAGRSVHGQIRLTRREEEVLAGVSDSLSNKEIASNLNLSERTVKFHVSSLLAKFKVRGRMELAREAARRAMGVVPEPMPMAGREARSIAPAIKAYPAPQRAASIVPLAKRQLLA
ncbi:MAG TPA: LuxR C-terminal-related transcriptional regulator, partial [Candidatus Dormibacteraeota bacterium]|nr:LuxR C-terminal-related transcriptional regulator [Candidatus Dormibacteraeota bacterium]